MNCDCIPDTALKLLDRLNSPEASKPFKGAHAAAVTCSNEGIDSDYRYVASVPYTVRWSLPDGKQRTTEVPVRMNFCPFCGKSAAKPQKTRKPKAPASPFLT